MDVWKCLLCAKPLFLSTGYVFFFFCPGKYLNSSCTAMHCWPLKKHTHKTQTAGGGSGVEESFANTPLKIDLKISCETTVLLSFYSLTSVSRWEIAAGEKNRLFIFFFPPASLRVPLNFPPKFALWWVLRFMTLGGALVQTCPSFLFISAYWSAEARHAKTLQAEGIFLVFPACTEVGGTGHPLFCSGRLRLL